MEKVSSNPFRLLGGRYALNWRNHFLFAIPAFLAAASFDYERLGGDPTVWLAIASIGFAVTVGVIEALRPVALRFKPGLGRAAAVLLVLLWAGFLRGLTIYLVGNTFEVIPNQDLYFRLIGGPIFVASVYAMTSSIFEGYLNYRNQLSRYELELNRLERSRASYAQDLQRVNKEQRTRVRELLAAPMWELQKKLETAKDPSGLQDALITMQSINNDVVRPLSHELSTTSVKIPEGIEARRNPQLSELLPEKLRTKEFQSTPLLVTVILSVGLNAQIGTSTPIRGLEIILVSLATILPMYFLERETVGRLLLPVWPAALMSFGLGFLSGSIAGFGVVWLGLANTENFWWQAGIYMVITRFIVLAYGIFDQRWRKAIQDRREVARELRRLNSILRQQLWLGQKSLAMELHGSVQGTLHALAARLAKMKQPKLEEISEILVLIRQALDRIENEDYLAGGTLPGLLSELKELWEGTLELDWQISESAAVVLERDLGLARCVFEIIRESVTNSVKHGNATEVLLKLSLNEDLVLEVINNGELVEDAQGFSGQELLEQLCLTHQLENAEGGVLLTARLALSPEVEQQFEI